MARYVHPVAPDDDPDLVPISTIPADGRFATVDGEPFILRSRDTRGFFYVVEHERDGRSDCISSRARVRRLEAS